MKKSENCQQISDFSGFFRITNQFLVLLLNIPNFEEIFFFHFFFQICFEFCVEFLEFLGKLIPQNSTRTPRNRFHIPRSPRKENLSFLDSSRKEILRGIDIPTVSVHTNFKFGIFFSFQRKRQSSWSRSVLVGPTFS